MTIDEMIARFLAVFGEPRSDHAEMFLAEYHRSLAGTSPAVLEAATSAVIDSEDYWPRPATLKRYVSAAAARLQANRRPAEHAPIDPTPPSPEARARVAGMLGALKRHMAAIPDAFKPPAPPPAADRVTFAEMREKSPNDYLHREAT